MRVKIIFSDGGDIWDKLGGYSWGCLNWDMIG